MGIPALPFYNYKNSVKRKFRKDYPISIQSIGDQLKRRRYDLRILQSEVASIFGVSEETIGNWEKGRSIPQIQFNKKIIEFLGYNPFISSNGESKSKDFKDQITDFRTSFGLSIGKFGALVGVDATTISSWEKGITIPKKSSKKRVLDLMKIWKKSMSKSTILPL